LKPETRRRLARTVGTIVATAVVMSVGAQPAPAKPVAAKYRDVSRCFFVYAALYESARKHARPELESYAIQRLMWVRGFMEALASDPGLKVVVEESIKENKVLAGSIDKKVSGAVESNTVHDYNEAVGEGEARAKRAIVG